MVTKYLLYWTSFMQKYFSYKEQYVMIKSCFEKKYPVVSGLITKFPFMSSWGTAPRLSCHPRHRTKTTATPKFVLAVSHNPHASSAMGRKSAIITYYLRAQNLKYWVTRYCLQRAWNSLFLPVNVTACNSELFLRYGCFVVAHWVFIANRLCVKM